MAKYQTVYILTKKANLLPYMTSKVANCSDVIYQRKYEIYAREREVQLIAMFRHEYSGNDIKCVCKIKCPINPLPVKGEFEVPSTSVLLKFLKANGWDIKQKVYPHMFE